MTSFSSAKNWSAPYPSMSTAYLKLPSTVGNTAITMPPSWTSAALSTISPTSNFDIENSPGIIEVRNDYFPLTLSPPYQPDREALRPRHPRTDVSGECESEQARAKQN